MAAKRISHSDIIGEQGIALVHQIVSGMGFLWHPTGGVEAGTDGFIEIRDPNTGEVANCILQIQSRATSKEFQGETSDRLEYRCDAKDLDYWLAGNAPVILVRSRPATNEAYWVSVKDYFKDVETRKQRKVIFDKKRDCFDQSSRDALVRLAVPKDSGLYLAPLPRTERLYSNLLKIDTFPEHIYSAKTDFCTPPALWSEFRARNIRVPGEWVLKSKQIFSVHDLREAPWKNICEAHSVKKVNARDWAYSDDPCIQRDFVWMLKRCLEQKAWNLGLRYDRKGRYYYFRPPERSPNEDFTSPRTGTLRTLSVSYKSLTEEASRDVFRAYFSERDPARVSYYRHSAFVGQFRRHDMQWYLEISPTYHFTWDGYKQSRFADDLIKGIKLLERNPAVLGHLLMWSSYLVGRSDIFAPQYKFLKFGELMTFEFDKGIDDSAWLGADGENSAIVPQRKELGLFE